MVLSSEREWIIFFGEITRNFEERIENVILSSFSNYRSKIFHLNFSATSFGIDVIKFLNCFFRSSVLKLMSQHIFFN